MVEQRVYVLLDFRQVKLATQADDAREELANLDGLGEMHLEACEEGAGAVFRPRKGGQGDCWRRPTALRWKVAHSLHQFVAVHLRHAEVRDEEIGARTGVEEAQCLFAGCREQAMDSTTF